MVQLTTGVLDLPVLLVLGVGLHKRQTDVALGHDDRELRLGMQALLRQILVQDGHTLAHVVATGGQCPTIMLELIGQ